jgi:hypothetical protein
MTIMRVKEPFAIAAEDGAHRLFAAGDLVDTSDSAYIGHEHLFEELNVAVERKGTAPTSADHPAATTTVERATAEPGELREIRPWEPALDQEPQNEE